MFPKRVTSSQHKKNKLHKKKLIKKQLKLLCKKETKLLSNIENNIPEDIVPVIYSFINNNIKLYVSHYKEIFTKFIFNYSSVKNFPHVFKDYIKFNYCTYDKTAVTLKEMLHKIPLDKLKKYLYFGTPSKYFNIAFPDEPNIQEYITTSYTFNDITSKNLEDIKNIYKNYVFEILDLLSYFSTKANGWHALRCDDKFETKNKNKYLLQLNLINNVHNYDEYSRQTEEKCKENELITRKIILSILYIFEKYGKK
jgi:hypothetical protein